MLNHLFQKKAGAKWSKTNRCWHIPCTENNYEKLAHSVKGIARLETDELKKYLLEKKRQNTKAVVTTSIAPAFTSVIKKEPSRKLPVQPERKTLPVSKENKEALQKFLQQLLLKSYSASTVRTYQNEFLQFLQAIKNVPAKKFTVQRVKDYLQYCFVTLKLSENTLHSRMNALKFYYEQVLKREKFFWEIPRPKKPLLLPKVISKEQIAMLINAIENTKHRTIIMLAYACGLRVSEVISLKVRHIDSQRKIIFIQNAKGKKDRIVSLSAAMLIMLRQYYKQYKPKDYLFEGQFENAHLSSRSIQQVLQKAKDKAGIKQEGSNAHAKT